MPPKTPSKPNTYPPGNKGGRPPLATRPDKGALGAEWEPASDAIRTLWTSKKRFNKSFMHAINMEHISVNDVVTVIADLQGDEAKQGLSDLTQIVEHVASRRYSGFREFHRLCHNDQLLARLGVDPEKWRAQHNGLVELGDVLKYNDDTSEKRFFKVIRLCEEAWDGSDEIEELMKNVVYGQSTWTEIAMWAHAESICLGRKATVGDMVVMATKAAIIRIHSRPERKDAKIAVTRADFVSGRKMWINNYPLCMTRVKDDHLRLIGAKLTRVHLLVKAEEVVPASDTDLGDSEEDGEDEGSSEDEDRESQDEGGEEEESEADDGEDEEDDFGSHVMTEVETALTDAAADRNWKPRFGKDQDMYVKLQYERLEHLRRQSTPDTKPALWTARSTSAVQPVVHTVAANAPFSLPRVLLRHPIESERELTRHMKVICEDLLEVTRMYWWLALTPWMVVGRWMASCRNVLLQLEQHGVGQCHTDIFDYMGRWSTAIEALLAQIAQRPRSGALGLLGNTVSGLSSLKRESERMRALSAPPPPPPSTEPIKGDIARPGAGAKTEHKTKDDAVVPAFAIGELEEQELDGVGNGQAAVLLTAVDGSPHAERRGIERPSNGDTAEAGLPVEQVASAVAEEQSSSSQPAVEEVEPSIPIQDASVSNAGLNTSANSGSSSAHRDSTDDIIYIEDDLDDRAGSESQGPAPDPIYRKPAHIPPGDITYDLEHEMDGKPSGYTIVRSTYRDVTVGSMEKLLRHRNWVGNVTIEAYSELLVLRKNVGAGCAKATVEHGIISYKMTSPAKFVVLHQELSFGTNMRGRWLVKDKEDADRIEEIFIILHPPGHWVLGIISPQRRKLSVIDSLWPGSYPSPSAERILRDKIKEIWGDDSGWGKECHPSSKQHNDYDCGVFLLWNLELYLDKSDMMTCNEAEMQERREFIAAELYRAGGTLFLTQQAAAWGARHSPASPTLGSDSTSVEDGKVYGPKPELDHGYSYSGTHPYEEQGTGVQGQIDKLSEQIAEYQAEVTNVGAEVESEGDQKDGSLGDGLVDTETHESSERVTTSEVPDALRPLSLDADNDSQMPDSKADVETDSGPPTTVTTAELSDDGLPENDLSLALIASTANASQATKRPVIGSDYKEEASKRQKTGNDKSHRPNILTEANRSHTNDSASLDVSAASLLKSTVASDGSRRKILLEKKARYEKEFEELALQVAELQAKMVDTKAKMDETDRELEEEDREQERMDHRSGTEGDN